MNNQAHRTNTDQDLTTYKVKFLRLLTADFPNIIIFSLVLWMLVTNKGTSAEKIFFALLVFILGGLLVYVFYRYLASSNQVLQISPDYDTFYFGDEPNQNKYDKNNIEKITIYQPSKIGQHTHAHYFYVYEILFKDSSTIKFSSMMISEQKVQQIFISDIIRYGLGKSPFWRL